MTSGEMLQILKDDLQMVTSSNDNYLKFLINSAEELISEELLFCRYVFVSIPSLKVNYTLRWMNIITKFGSTDRVIKKCTPLHLFTIVNRVACSSLMGYACSSLHCINDGVAMDDGVSGTSFERSGFQQMQKMAEEGKICRIIVKDLSRFGREQVEAGRLTQIVYPFLGITFISIQENVNSSTGNGMEMLPFYNIFNEWYAAQTSKKIRAVWQSKAEHGERVSPTVPFGYMKSEGNPKEWVVDEPAAQVVKKIYVPCLAGRGPSQIARQFEKEQVLVSFRLL